MSRFLVRRCIAYLLIALLPLQAAAAGRFALCVAMKAPPAESTNIQSMDHCAPMSALQSQRSARASSASSHPVSPSSPHDGCWLGSMCLAGLVPLALPAAYVGVDVERHGSIYPSPTARYLSFISESPLRPPAVLR